ncbi:hypothetical protein GALL_484670 [mine drainage metagenome]|uniref:Uncharacterized protein n=1 Tax=mine drainage metagenome TaxID=410659 RepID=A0A1J5PQ90_9ZZZZ
MGFNFYLDEGHKLGWGTDKEKPILTEQQAMIVAIADVASAMEEIAKRLVLCKR